MTFVLYGNGYIDPFRVTNSVLRGMVRSGELSHDEYKSVKKFAFEQAQFDEDRASLQTPNGAASESPQLTLLEALQRVSENTLNYTAGLMASQSGAASNKSESGKSSSPAVNAASNAPRASGASSSGHAGDSGAPSETFLWKPQSDSNGNLVILLPASLSDDAVAVTLLSPDGTRVIGQGDFSGIGNGRRKHFRFGKSGEAFPPGTIVQISMKDGTQRFVTIDNPGERLEKKGA